MPLMDKIKSSYMQNHYGELLREVVLKNPPDLVVEAGVLDGYSTRWIAQGLKDNAYGYMISYDLWDKYQYNHGDKNKVIEYLKENGVDGFVELRDGDIFEVSNDFKDHSIDMLHIDISNTGDTLRKIIDLYNVKMKFGGFILFEGGSEERDNIEWMTKYKSPPIKKELETNEVIENQYEYITYSEFPSLTILRKR
jgi:predicted O-methyltransferase YrrM